MPALSFGRLPGALQARGTQDIRLLDRCLGTQGSRSAQGANAEYVGTAITAVLKHVISLPARRRPKVILIATDGYVGQARHDLVAGLRRTRAVVASQIPCTQATFNHGPTK